jgi:O-antigen ligase
VTAGALAPADELFIRDRPARRLLGLGLLVAVLGLPLLGLAAGLGLVLGRASPGWPLVLAFGLGVLGSLVLATARYDVLVALGIALLAIVRVEPAPSDLIFGVAIAVALVTGRLSRVAVAPGILWLATLFIALNLLSAVEVVDAGRASVYLSITLYLLVFAVWLASYVDSTRRAALVAWMWIAAAVISAAAASLALFVSFPGHEALLFDGERARGFFKDPLVYAPFLIPAALIVVEHTIAPGAGRFRRLLGAAIFLTLALGVLFSYSRAAWLNLVIGLVVLAVVVVGRSGGGRQMLALAAIVLLAAAAAVGTIRMTGSEEFLAQRSQLQAYDEQRFGAQLFGIEQSMRYPLGIGPGQFEALAPLSAHSLYVRALSEQGLLGLLTLLALLLVTLSLALANAVAGRDTYGVGSAALLGAWCGLLANSFFVDTLHWRHLWLVAALIWAGSAVKRSAPPVPGASA